MRRIKGGGKGKGKGKVERCSLTCSCRPAPGRSWPWQMQGGMSYDEGGGGDGGGRRGSRSEGGPGHSLGYEEAGGDDCLEQQAREALEQLGETVVCVQRLPSCLAHFCRFTLPLVAAALNGLKALTDEAHYLEFQSLTERIAGLFFSEALRFFTAVRTYRYAPLRALHIAGRRPVRWSSTLPHWGVYTRT